MESIRSEGDPPEFEKQRERKPFKSNAAFPTHGMTGKISVCVQHIAKYWFIYS